MKTNFSEKRRKQIGNLNKKLLLEIIEKIKEKALTRKKKRFFIKSVFIKHEKNSKPIILYNLNHTVYG